MFLSINQVLLTSTDWL